MRWAIYTSDQTAPQAAGNSRFSDVEEVNRVIVTGKSSKLMVKVGTLPSLRDGSVVERVRLVRPDTLDKTRLVLLIVVENGVCYLLAVESDVGASPTERFVATGLDLAIGPSRDLNNVAHDAVVALFRVQGNIVPKGNRLTILL